MKMRCQEIESALQRHRGHLDEATGTLREHRGLALDESRRLADMAAEGRRERERLRREEELRLSHLPGSTHSTAGGSRFDTGFRPATAVPELNPFRLQGAKWNPKPRTDVVETAGVFTDRELAIRRQERLFGAAILAPVSVLPEAGDSVTFSEMLSTRLPATAFNQTWAGRSRPHIMERSYNWGGVTAGERWQPTPRLATKDVVSAIAQADSVAQRSGFLSARLRGDGRRVLERGAAGPSVDSANPLTAR